jgi:hypothetical protein
MSSVAFKQKKREGIWFQELVYPLLENLGMEVIDSDKERYAIKKGYDCLVRVKNPDGNYKRNEAGYIVQDKIEIKLDKMSEQTGNVFVDLDSIRKSTASIWIYGLPEGSSIGVYATLLTDLGPYAESYPIKRPGGEFGLSGALIPKATFISLPFIKKFKIINLD